jgi:SNF2 family DNA or RNA helicase
MNIKALLEQFNNRRLKRKVIKSLIKRYQMDYEVELVLEQWIIKRILDGQVARRPELAEKQQRLKEIKLFIEYFTNPK